MYADITVLGGIPVTIEFYILGSDPSVGFFDDTIDSWDIIAIKGRECKTPPNWLYKAIKLRGEELDIIEKLFLSTETRED